MQKYVPILKYKKGEQVALTKLDENIKDYVIPFFEIPLASSQKATSINRIWQNRPFYFSLKQGKNDKEKNLAEIDSAKKQTISQIIYENKMGIPVFNLEDLSQAELQDWICLSTNGIGIRIQGNSFDNIENKLNSFFSNGELSRRNTDLFLDLRYCFSSDLYAKKTVLKVAFSDLDKAAEYRSIIIASCSFPKQMPHMETNKASVFPRVEAEIHEFALKLSNRFGFNYIYSDYGASNLEEIQIDPKKISPCVKIKYTTPTHYTYIKGYQVKHHGLDIANVQNMCKVLVNCGDFFGESFSWGDNKMYQLAQGFLKSPGNLATWVSYVMNHHITLIPQIL